jgi:hypothetical protein
MQVVDRMPMLDMLRYILTHLYGSLVSTGQAYEVESKCLEVRATKERARDRERGTNAMHLPGRSVPLDAEGCP